MHFKNLPVLVVFLSLAALARLTAGADRGSPAASGAATHAAGEWNVDWVALDERDDRWKADDKPGIFTLGNHLFGDPAAYDYQMAAGKRYSPGDEGVVGCFAAMYPDEASFKVSSFGLIGSRIHVTIQQHARGGNKSGYHSARGKRLFFTAKYPNDLPEGHYDVVCTVVHADAKDSNDKPETLAVAFDRTDVPFNGRPLQALSDADLLAEYIASGTAAQDTSPGPRDAHVVGIAFFEMEDVRIVRWQVAQAEITWRGAAMVPLLVDLLKREVPRNAGVARPEETCPFGFARDVMDLLSQAHDARAALLMVEILEGYGGQANSAIRRAALESLANLTYVAFVTDEGLPNRNILPHATARQRSDLVQGNDRRGEWAFCAAGYREWLAHEGKDPSQWLNLARTRARGMLEGENRIEALAGLEFLSGFQRTPTQGDPDCWTIRDDQPARTFARVIKVLDENEHGHPVDVRRWLRSAGLTPLARPNSATLLRVVRDNGNSPQDIEVLGNVGGKEIVAYFVEQLRLHSHSPDAGANPGRAEPAQSAAAAYRSCIARWAGQVFANDPAIFAWWEANKDKTQQQWLTDALDATAVRADTNDPDAQHILRRMLPDLPYKYSDYPWGGWEWSGHVRRAPYRVAWLAQHRSALVYDEAVGGFRLRVAATAPSSR